MHWLFATGPRMKLPCYGMHSTPGYESIPANQLRGLVHLVNDRVNRLAKRGFVSRLRRQKVPIYTALLYLEDPKL